MFAFFQSAVGVQHIQCGVLRLLQRFHIIEQVGNLQFGQTMLPFTEKVAGAALFEVKFRHSKAIVCFGHQLQPCPGSFPFCVGDEDAVGLRLAASDTSAQLMKLRQAEAFGVFDHHDSGIRHIDADLDHRGGNQKPDLSCGKARHHIGLFLRLHFAVQQPNLIGRKLLFRQRFRILHRRKQSVLALLNGRADDIALFPGVKMLFQKRENARVIAAVHRVGQNLFSSAGQLVDHGDVQITVDHQRKCARDRRCGHHKYMGRTRFFGQYAALTHAEAVLLVGHNERERGKLHIAREQRMGADRNVGFAGFQRLLDRAFFLCGNAAGQKHHTHLVAEQNFQRFVVLLCKDLRGRHQRALQSVFRHCIQQRRSDRRFAGADVALDQTVHHISPGKIAQAVLHGTFLRVRKPKRQPCFKRSGKRGIHSERAALSALHTQQRHAALQHKQLFKNQPPPCDLHLFEGSRRVDVR